MYRRLVSASVALAVGFAPIAATAACFGTAETSAVQVRMLQSELMVAALACRDSNPELRMIDAYNGFMRKFGDRLVSHSKVLQARFQHDYGKDYQRRMDAFITSLANDASKRSMVSSYCESSSTLFAQVTELPRADLERLSATRAGINGSPVAACAAEPTVSASREQR